MTSLPLQLPQSAPRAPTLVLHKLGEIAYTEFIKMAGAPERGILGPTEYLFMDFFRLKENQEYRSLKEKQKI